MNTKLPKWLPIVVCCLPGVALAAVIGTSIAAGSATLGSFLGGALDIGLIVLAAFACPLSMGLMVTRNRASSQRHTSNGSQMMADCCAPGEEVSSTRLESLRAQRKSLERELAELLEIKSR